MGERKLFISHAAVDRDLAALLEETAYLTIPGIQVFRASRIGQIKPGREWFDVVTNHLRDADLYLVLLTETSVKNPWVSFEAGTAWYTGRPLVPVLAPGFRPSDVPEPLRFLQLISLSNPSEAKEAFKELGGELSDPDKFVSRAVKLAQQDQRRTIQDLGWKGIEFQGGFYAYNGPIEKLPEGDPVPMPKQLYKEFENKGHKCELGRPEDLTNQFSKGYKRVWLIENWERRHQLRSEQEQQQLCVRPKESQ